MHRAYVFRRGVPASPENRELAEAVTVDEYVPAPADRIRCIYEPCFQPLTPVVPTRARSHWRHPKDAPSGHYCPYRTDRAGGADWRPSRAALDDLRSRLQDRVPGGCRVGRVAGVRDEVLTLGDWAVVVPLHADNVRAMAEVEELDGKPVFLVVALDDLQQINELKLKPFLRAALERIVERQPVLVVRPALEGPAGGWGLLTSPRRLTLEEIEELLVDALPVLVDARELFGRSEGPQPAAAWPPPGPLPIWIRPAPKEGVDAVQEELAETTPLGARVLRLLAKRLLVDGAGVHRILFSQTLDEARDFFRVSETTFPRADQVIRETDLPYLAESPGFTELLAAEPVLGECFEALAEEGRRRERTRAEAAERREREREEREERMESGLATVHETVEAIDERVADAVARLDEEIESLRQQTSGAFRASGPLSRGLRDLKTKARDLETRTDDLRKGVVSLGQDFSADRDARVEEGKEIRMELRGEIQGLHEDLDEQLAGLRKELAGQRTELRRQGRFEHRLAWALGTAVGVAVVLASLVWPGWPGGEWLKAGTEEAAGTEQALSGAPGDEASDGASTDEATGGASADEAGPGTGRTAAEVEPGANGGAPDPDDSHRTPSEAAGFSRPSASEASPQTAFSRPSTPAANPDPASNLPDAPAPTASPPEPPPPIPPSPYGTLRIDVAADRARGGLMIYSAGERLWDGDLAGLTDAAGTVVAERRLDAGPLELLVHHWRRGRPTRTRTLRTDLPGGGTLTLRIRVDRDGRLEAVLVP
jgi:hypothetical protein